MSSARRRWVGFSALLIATALAASLIAISPGIGVALTAIIVVVLFLYVVLLRRRRMATAERSMALAFRSRRASGRAPGRYPN